MIHAKHPKIGRAAMRAGRLLACGCVMWLVGCGPDGPQRVPVSGTVMLDGKPVGDATIIFTPSSEGGLAAAATIENGTFVLTGLDGPTAGEHGVRINPNEAEMEAVDPAELAPEQLRAERRPRIPRVYQQAGELSASVTGEPQQVLEFELSSKR